MAKSRRRKAAGSDTEVITPNVRIPGIGDSEFDPIDWAVFIGVVLVTLVVPFLYSRMTTENFLTPKEFVSKISLAVLGGVFCLRFLRDGGIKMAKSTFDYPLALFFLLAVLSLAWNFNTPSAIRDLRGTFLILLLFPLIVNTVRSRLQFDILLWAMVLTGIGTAALGIMESYNLYFKFFDQETGSLIKFVRDDIFAGKIDYNGYYLPLFPQLASRDFSMMSIVSTFGNRNYLGTYLMFTAFIPLGFFFYYRNAAMKVVSMGLFAVMLMGLYITRCRASLLGLMAGMAFMVLFLYLLDRQWRFLKRNREFFVVVALILAVVFLFAVVTAKSSSMWDKLKLTFSLDRKTSNSYERLWVWYATFQSFAHDPFKWVLGSGFGSYKHFFPLQEADTFDDENKETFTPVTFRQTHNDWLQLVSELGLVGLAFLLFIVWRFFAGIYRSIRASVDQDPQGELTGDHVLLIGMGAAMVSQLVAAVPDFPFHRIETALYAVILISMIPVIAETGFFRRPLPQRRLMLNAETTILLAVFIGGTSLLAVNHELKCWKADTMVRQAETYISMNPTPEGVNEAKKILLEAIRMDPLPGDPYLKLASVFEMLQDGEGALAWADKAWKNINFNARSTYHSVIFRKMHTYYHVLRDRPKAFELAKRGQYLTCGDARSVYYFYLGKIAMELGDLKSAEWALEHCAQFPQFTTQAAANLAVVLAQAQKWDKALAFSASLSASINDTDPTLLDVVGISASNLGQYATAERALRKAVELQPGQSVYKRDLGVTLVRQGRLVEARGYLETALTAGDLPEAIKGEVRTILASVSSAMYNQGADFINKNRREEGVQVLKQLIAAKVGAEPQVKQAVELLRSLGALQAEQASGASAVAASGASPAPGSPAVPVPVPAPSVPAAPASPSGVPPASAAH